jgi:hypothetical protein
VRSISYQKKSLCFCLRILLSFLGNGSINTFQVPKRIVWGIVFCGVCVVSREMRRLVLPRTSCVMLSCVGRGLMLSDFLLSYPVKCLKEFIFSEVISEFEQATWTNLWSWRRWRRWSLEQLKTSHVSRNRICACARLPDGKIIYYWVHTPIAELKGKQTEYLGRVASIPALYLGCPRFLSQSGDQISWFSVFVTFLSPSWWIQGLYFELCHEGTFYILHNSLFTNYANYSTLYNLSYLYRR